MSHIPGSSGPLFVFQNSTQQATPGVLLPSCAFPLSQKLISALPKEEEDNIIRHASPRIPLLGLHTVSKVRLA